MQDPIREVQVAYGNEPKTVPAADVRRAVVTVLDGEATGPAEVSITFLSAGQMRGLNRRTFGKDRATDVIAFELSHPGRIVGDVYVCPSVARKRARKLTVSERQECLRLVVHGTLHVLGYQHPDGAERTVSLMWRLQERYVRRITESPT